MASFLNQISTKSIFRPGLAPDPCGEAYVTTLPRHLVRWLGDTHLHVSFLSPPSASRYSVSAPTEWGCDRAPREWFSGPRCGCRRAWLEIERTLLLTALPIVIDEVSNSSKVYDFEWPKQYLRFFAADFCEIKLLPDVHVSAAMSTAAKSSKWNKQPAHSVSVEIYSTITLFTCDSTDFLLSKSVLSRLKSLYFQVGSSHISSKSSTWRGSNSKSGQIAVVRVTPRSTGIVYRHFFGRCESIPQLISGQLPYRYAVGHSIAATCTFHYAVHEIWSVIKKMPKSLKLLRPDSRFISYVPVGELGSSILQGCPYP